MVEPGLADRPLGPTSVLEGIEDGPVLLDILGVLNEPTKEDAHLL